MKHFDDIGFQIKRISDSMSKKANHDLEKFGITFSQFQILFFLHQRKRIKTSQKDLENHFEVSSPTISGILKRLESKGFITTEFDDQDKRVKHIYLTQKERKLFYQMKSSRGDMEKTLTRNFTEPEVWELKALLEKVYENVNSPEDIAD
ncbi:MarR family transcriptional regulator [Brucepastera parasyntrophica]|uniref:MarR family winged helix-turn-helix transcriptional regulator n=1 Tax=Brucepastera parasyntrophica TaxID=2880008 RepID=UPI00210E55A2|nr:MarR family transcriptional regulator [Brucepastera parasyntrophica]ULQ58722.1 MarR family transcriptional regulator [Brucepastera parasyntrophica]